MVDSTFGTVMKRFVLSFVAGVLVGQGGLRLFYDNRMPKADKVQNGYTLPSKLEIQLEDLDGNGEKETIMRYDGKSYLLRLDDSGKPSVQAYEVRPAEVAPKTE